MQHRELGRWAAAAVERWIEDPLDRRSGTSEEPRALRGPSRHHYRLEQLPDRAEGEPTLELATGRAYDACAVAIDSRNGSGDERALAGARRALDEDRLAGPAPCPAHGRAHRLQLGVALQQRWVIARKDQVRF